MKIFNFADYSIYVLNTGQKLLQTLLNVLALLLAKTNETIALSIALNIIGLLTNLFILASRLYSLIMFLYLKHLLLLKMQFRQTILLLNLHQFILMDTNIIIFLQN